MRREIGWKARRAKVIGGGSLTQEFPLNTPTKTNFWSRRECCDPTESVVMCSIWQVGKYAPHMSVVQDRSGS